MPEREGIAIKERIIAACIELAAVKGFYNATVNELAERAGLSKRTLYRYFRSKDEIIAAAIDSMITELSAEAEHMFCAEKPPQEVFAEIIDYVLRSGNTLLNPLVMEDLSRHYPHHWKKIDDFRTRRIKGNFRAFLQNRTSDLNGEILPEIVTAVIAASVQAVLNPEFLLSNGLKPHDAGRQLLGLFMNGILSRG